MAFASSSGTTSISGSVTSTAYKASATVITGTATGVATTTIGTVGAGKVWRILGLQLGSGQSGAVWVNYYLKLNGTQVLRHLTSSTATTTANESSTLNFDYGVCPVLTAGQTVQVQCDSANGEAVACVVYVEETA